VSVTVREALRLGLRLAPIPYVVSRLVLWTAAFIANRVIPYGPIHDPERGSWLQGFIGWDAEHYLGIARHGYPVQVVAPSGNNGYFPLLPLLLRLVGAGDGAALALAFVLGLLAFVALAALTAAVLDPDSARRTVWVAAFWPAAFFWSAVYTESLFLVLAIACVWAAWRRQVAIAALAGLLAGLTRPDGFVLVVPMIVLLGPGRRRLAAVAPALGTALVAALLAINTGNPLALPIAFFSHGNLSPGRPWGLLQTATLWARYGDWQQVAELPVLLGVAALLVLLGRERHWRAPALATSLSLLVAPIGAGTVSSFARYAMVAFPIYWPLRRWPLLAVLAVEVPVAVAWTVFATTAHLTP
jgi:mannosyltransferase PIG-V